MSDWLTAALVGKAILTVIGLWVVCWICGTALCFVLSDDAPELRARVRRWWRRRRQRSQFSATWTRQQEQQESRVEYHGPKITWPIRPKEQ